MSFPIHSVNPNLFSVPYSAPLSLLCVPPSVSSPAQPQPGHFTSLLSVLPQLELVCSWIVGVSVPCRFQQPCKPLISLSRHRFLQGSNKILQV